MSRPIGAYFHVPHGISNAMLLDKCLSYVVDGGISRFAGLVGAVGLETAGDSERVLADKFIKALGDICRFCKVPTLGEYGIDKEKFFAVMDRNGTRCTGQRKPCQYVEGINERGYIDGV